MACASTKRGSILLEAGFFNPSLLICSLTAKTRTVEDKIQTGVNYSVYHRFESARWRNSEERNGEHCGGNSMVEDSDHSQAGACAADFPAIFRVLLYAKEILCRRFSIDKY